MNRNRIATVAAASALLVALSGCAAPAADDGSSQDDGALDVVTLRHSWIPDDTMMPIAVAEALGYYEEEGIDLQDEIGDGGATAAKLVANETVMIGTGEAAHVLTGRSNGLDLVSFATQNQWTSTALVSLKETGIEDWSDLEGKRISISFTSSSYAALLTALDINGVDADSVELVNLAPGADLASALPSGEIDVATVFIGNIGPLPYRDDLNALPLADAGVNWPSTGYFVKEEFLEDEQNVDLLTRWLRATLKGLQHCIDDPLGSAELMAELYPDVDPAAIAAKWDLSAPFIVGDLGDNPLGWQNDAAWEEEAVMLLESEIITSPVDATEAFTNAIVEAAAAK